MRTPIHLCRRMPGLFFPLSLAQTAWRDRSTCSLAPPNFFVLASALSSNCRCPTCSSCHSDRDGKRFRPAGIYVLAARADEAAAVRSTTSNHASLIATRYACGVAGAVGEPFCVYPIVAALTCVEPQLP